MANEIKILCPSRKCGKCRRMVARVEEALNLSGIQTEIQIIDSIEEMMQYPTWILPTLVINGNIVAKGYIPSVQNIQEYLTNN
ncbi:MAG: thioredoxin family protein [Bacteroidales bacterium]